MFGKFPSGKIKRTDKINFCTFFLAASIETTKNAPKRDKSWLIVLRQQNATRNFDAVHFFLTGAERVVALLRRIIVERYRVDARTIPRKRYARTLLRSASFEPLEFADATFSRELLPGRPHSGGDRRARSQARKSPRESFSGRTAGLSTRQRLADDMTGRARARRRCASFLRRARYT